MKYLLLLFILVNSCGSSKTQDDSLPFEVLRHAINGGKETQSFDVISNQDQLNNLNALISKDFYPKPKALQANFKEETIASLSLGQKNSGGFDISVEKVIETSSEITVYYNLKGPKPTDMVTMALTEPYCVIKFVNKKKKKVLFKEMK